jgi:hypothetical protein
MTEQSEKKRKLKDENRLFQTGGKMVISSQTTVESCSALSCLYPNCWTWKGIIHLYMRIISRSPFDVPTTVRLVSGLVGPFTYKWGTTPSPNTSTSNLNPAFWIRVATPNLVLPVVRVLSCVCSLEGICRLLGASTWVGRQAGVVVTWSHFVSYLKQRVEFCDGLFLYDIVVKLNRYVYKV